MALIAQVLIVIPELVASLAGAACPVLTSFVVIAAQVSLVGWAGARLVTPHVVSAFAPLVNMMWAVASVLTLLMMNAMRYTLQGFHAQEQVGYLMETQKIMIVFIFGATVFAESITRLIGLMVPAVFLTGANIPAGEWTKRLVMILMGENGIGAEIACCVQLAHETR
jgi:hypothetical protein